jgi:hypothetical protein
MNDITPAIAPSTSTTWGNLRKAITDTPGFQHWCKNSHESRGYDLDLLIQAYLAETLETLAY